MGNSSVTVRARPVTREKLARALGNNQELIRMIENLVVDVTINIPEGMDALQAIAEDNSASINMALSISGVALDVATQANEVPPPMPYIPATDDEPPAPVLMITDAPDELASRVAALEAQLSQAMRMISDLKEGPTP